MKFITQPLSQIPLIVGRQKDLFIFSLLSIILIFGSLIYGGLVADDLETGFYLISISQFVYSTAFIFWLLKLTGNKV